MLFFDYYQPFVLENNEILPTIRIAYQTYGKLNASKNNVVWICHALTANAEATTWWSGLVGASKCIDIEKYFVVCANILGSCYGSTYALSINPLTQRPYFHTFPLITIRDMVKAHILLRKHLGIEKILLGIGGSLGGQQVVEWAIQEPEVFENIVLIATNAVHSAWGIAFNESQRMAIATDATWQTDSPQAGINGMKTARSIALLSYRNYNTYQHTQTEPNSEKLENFRASSYQNYQGEKLAKRFDAFAYWTLSKAMDSHNVGRGRGSIEQALAKIKAKTLCIGISSDILFPPTEQQFLAQHIPHATYKEIHSLYGHDGFLLEYEALTRLLNEFVFANNTKSIS
ncbi:MAG: homoserine O-acetyltransferase [Microscillaceae bacterium]|nr:homoserine O-acetyltransferase [Microscillaceae bacterium]MDW8460465.1 homoserine O-acetyltransferase [Cytophagales bacterium]